VIGQDHAKKVLSVAVYNHYKRIFHNTPAVPAAVSNSGSGSGAGRKQDTGPQSLNSRGATAVLVDLFHKYSLCV